MKKITIPIPEKEDLKHWWNILRFKFQGGFKCEWCNTKSDFNHVEFESKIHGKRFIFSNHKQGQCVHCTESELLKCRADDVFTEENCKCDWCGEHKTTMSFPRANGLDSRVIFGSNYWNGHHICKDCLKIGFLNRDPLKSSIIEYKDGQMYYKNELGLRIKIK